MRLPDHPTAEQRQQFLAGEGGALAPVLVDHDEGRLTVREVLGKRYYYGRSIPSFCGTKTG